MEGTRRFDVLHDVEEVSKKHEQGFGSNSSSVNTRVYNQRKIELTRGKILRTNCSGLVVGIQSPLSEPPRADDE